LSWIRLAEAKGSWEELEGQQRDGADVLMPLSINGSVLIILPRITMVGPLVQQMPY